MAVVFFRGSADSSSPNFYQIANPLSSKDIRPAAGQNNTAGLVRNGEGRMSKEGILSIL
jgi:hypothetical protein